MKATETKFGYTVTDCKYTADEAQAIKELVGTGRFVVVKNSDPVPAATLVPFYRSIGIVATQNEKVIGSGVDGFGELVRVVRNRLFTGKDDGELEWHSAGMNRTGAEDIVCMYMSKPASTGGNTFFSDTQGAWNALDDDTKKLCRTLKSKVVTYKVGKRINATHYKNVFHDEQTMMEFRDADGKQAFFKQTPRKDLVTKHPINGELGLYFPWSVIRGFAGIDHDTQ